MQQLPRLELTIKSLIIGIVLAVILCGTNIYLGLKIGNTISASIPASILALGVLRFFRKHSIYETNIAQTIASSGEAIAGVMIFIFPALLILGTWHNFHYLDMAFLSICGGLIGTIYSIILRRVLLNDKVLKFPEGVAIGNILISTSGRDNKGGIGILLSAMSIAAIVNFCQTGLQIFASSYIKIIQIGKSLIGIGSGFSTAVIGAGYLVGFNSMLVGVLSMFLGWLILIPIYSHVAGISDVNNLTKSAFFVWQHYIRPIGIGVLMFGGFATIGSMLRPIFHGVRDSVIALKDLHKADFTDTDINIKYLLAILLLCCVPLFLFINHQLTPILETGAMINGIVALLLLLLLLVIGFAIAAVGGYFAGLVGSSTSPLSGLLFIAVILISIIFIIITTGAITAKTSMLFSTIIFLVAFIGFNSAITNENIQDYKSGSMIGASPAKQQIALFIGVICSSLVAPIMVNLVFNAYGIAGIVPHAGIRPEHTLNAPQAAAIAMIVKNVLFRVQNWGLIFIGMVIGLFCLILDKILNKRYGYRCPAVAAGIGLYLPPDIVFNLFIGGVIRLIINRKHKQLRAANVDTSNLEHRVNLLACGLIAGESLMGLFLAIPFVIMQSSDAFKMVSDKYSNGIAAIFSALIILGVMRWMYKTATKKV